MARKSRKKAPAEERTVSLFGDPIAPVHAPAVPAPPLLNPALRNVEPKQPEQPEQPEHGPEPMPAPAVQAPPPRCALPGCAGWVHRTERTESAFCRVHMVYAAGGGRSLRDEQRYRGSELAVEKGLHAAALETLIRTVRMGLERDGKDIPKSPPAYVPDPPEVTARIRATLAGAGLWVHDDGGRDRYPSVKTWDSVLPETKMALRTLKPSFSGILRPWDIQDPEVRARVEALDKAGRDGHAKMGKELEKEVDLAFRTMVADALRRHGKGVEADRLLGIVRPEDEALALFSSEEAERRAEAREADKEAQRALSEPATTLDVSMARARLLGLLSGLCRERQLSESAERLRRAIAAAARPMSESEREARERFRQAWAALPDRPSRRPVTDWIPDEEVIP